jgi:hypothetical protein
LTPKAKTSRSKDKFKRESNTSLNSGRSEEKISTPKNDVSRPNSAASQLNNLLTKSSKKKKDGLNKSFSKKDRHEFNFISLNKVVEVDDENADSPMNKKREKAAEISPLIHTKKFRDNTMVNRMKSVDVDIDNYPNLITQVIFLLMLIGTE